MHPTSTSAIVINEENDKADQTKMLFSTCKNCRQFFNYEIFFIIYIYPLKFVSAVLYIVETYMIICLGNYIFSVVLLLKL